LAEAEIWLKKDARPVSLPPYQIYGERRTALDKLVGEALDQHKMERGQVPWNTPIFPVPKKNLDLIVWCKIIAHKIWKR